MNLKVVAERQGRLQRPDQSRAALLAARHRHARHSDDQGRENEGDVTISANGNAPLQKWKVCVVGSADFGKGPVWFSTQLDEIEVARAVRRRHRSRAPSSIRATARRHREARAEAAVRGQGEAALLGLPPNTTADEQEITKDNTEVKFTVKADKTAPAGQHKQLFCQFTLAKDGETMTSAFAQGGILRIDKATVAKNEEPKK